MTKTMPVSVFNIQRKTFFVGKVKKTCGAPAYFFEARNLSPKRGFMGGGRISYSYLTIIAVIYFYSWLSFMVVWFGVQTFFY